MPGDDDSPREVRLRLQTLRRTLGADGFAFAADDLDELDFEEAYDPDTISPAEREGIEEDER